MDCDFFSSNSLLKVFTAWSLPNLYVTMATIDMKNNISLDTSASVDLTFSTAVVISIVCADE